MKYMGSKNRIAKHILPIMLKDRKEGQYWVEPFVGGANMIDKVGGNRIGADFNKYVIDALTVIRDNIDCIPKNNHEFTELDYKRLREDESWLKGFAGFAYSYAGKWLGGWSRDGANKRDYVKEAYSNALKQSKFIQGVKFISGSYQDLDIPNNSIIYCDPPYECTTSYKDKFSHSAFWNWCRKKHNQGHTIFVSEYNAPADFTCVWEKEVNSSLAKDTGSKKAIEKLFTLGNQ